jgi:phage terminase small subunit
MPKLANPRWEAFAKFIATGKTRHDAYQSAGFEVKSKIQRSSSAQKLMAKPEVKARITEIEDDLRTGSLIQAEVDRAYVLTELKRNHEKCSEEEQILDRSGKPTGELKFNAAGSNKSLELIGKELGMFADRLILDNLDEKIEGMSDNDLREFVMAAASEVGLRMVGMTDDEARKWIRTNAPRLGIGLAEGSGDADGAQDAEAGAVQALPEGEEVSRSGPH